MSELPHEGLASLREKINQQRNTIKALKRDGHECADAERHLRDLLAEEQALITPSPKAPDDLQFLPQ
jgi:hypothetical protein